MRILASVSLAVLAIAACGGQTVGSNADGNPSGTTDAGGGAADGGVVTPVADASVDAPHVDDGGSDQYPAPHHPMPQLKPLGGPVLTNLKIVTITYTGDAERDALRAFDSSLVAANSTWWTTVTNGYGVGAGTALAPVELDAADVANKSFDNDTTLKDYIQSLITAGKLPAPDSQTLYNFYFPSSTTISLQGSQSCQAFGAYHDSKVFNVGGAMVEAAFSIVPNCGGGRSVSASHEIIEAATDPHPQDMTAWYAYNDAWFGAGGGEIADLCESRGSATWNGNDVALAWSNSEAKASHDPCVPSDPNKIFFGAAVDTNEMFLSHDPTGGPDYMSEGYISISPGGTKTVPVDVFSAAKLPHDLTIVVGKQARGSMDPHNVTAIGTGITATLSATTARNGSKLTLKIDAAATAAKKDYPFVVRAILENNDYHSWWVILRVM